MPILVKDFTWNQTGTTVNIRVPVSQSHHEKADVLITDSYIKAHFNPFFFEVYLLHDISAKQSCCIIKDDEITFDLTKRDDTEWESLEKALSKAEKMNLKQEVLEKTRKEAEELAEERRVRKTHLDRFMVQQAMDIDNQKINLMDSRRDAERNKAMEDLEEWRQTSTEESKEDINVKKTISGIIANNENAKQVNSKESDCIPGDMNKRATIVELPDDNNQTKRVYPKVTKKPVKTPVRSEYVEKKRLEMEKRTLPQLRPRGSIEITHTKRTFPTPSRESTAQEEETWIKNVTLARRATGFVSEDLRPEEQDPQWCKAKGDEFFRAGNFLGAISAYTHGLTLSDKLPSLFANRAAVHFALGNFNKCMNDCSSALELLKPACEVNRRSRAKCIARRAAALARIGYLSKAIDEMKAASKLIPDDEAVKQDIRDMEKAWEQDPDSN